MNKGSVVWGIIFANRYHFETGSSLRTIQPSLVLSTEQDSQLLLNVFTKWCRFGIKKDDTSSTQFKPRLRINNKLISPVKIGDNFIYLRNCFSFNMNNDDIKVELVTDVNDYFDILNQLLITDISTSYWLFRSIFIVD